MKSIINEKGMVLVIALILILPLTLIAVSVMQWAREDLKMIGSLTDRNNAEQNLTGIMQEVMIINNLAATLSTMSASGSVTTDSGNVIPLTLRAETSCKRRFSATSESSIKNCRYVDADNSDNFGKGNTGQIQMTLNIEQPLLSTNGN
nr:PilX N-terminal domain-containing pilus assembly protein [uncultured Tolumonas sp.]